MIERWVTFWDRREQATSLALTRILLAIVLLADLSVGRYEGAMPAVLVPPPLGMGSGAAPYPAALLARWFVSSPEMGLLWWRVAVIATLMFLLGVWHRAAGVLLTLVLVNLARFDPDTESIDTLLRIAVPILTLSRANVRWSVDAWFWRKLGKPLPTLVAAWPRYLLILQLLWFYFSAAHCRDHASWWPQGGFSAIGNVLGDPHFARFPPGSLAGFYPLTQMATVVTMTFEMSAPLMVLWMWPGSGRLGRLRTLGRRWRLRWVWIAAGMSLHLGIAVTMKLGIFPFGMLALYPLLVDPDEYVKARRAFRAWYDAVQQRARRA